MARRLVNLTRDVLDDLPSPCRSCVFWERPPAGRPDSDAAAAQSKAAWVSDTLLQWGSCGQLLYVDGTLAGFATYAPPAYVPRSSAFPTSPIGADAVLLMTARIVPAFAGGGLGRVLLQGVARDITRRGVRAIEAFGRTDSDPNPQRDCVLPVDFLLACGFTTVRPHPTTPRLRLDVRSLLTWREDMESALERLLGTISASVPGLSRG